MQFLLLAYQMFRSLNLDSINDDDALFGSGTVAWNPSTSPSDILTLHSLEDQTSTMTLQNQEETRNTPRSERHLLQGRQVLFLCLFTLRLSNIHWGSVRLTVHRSCMHNK